MYRIHDILVWRGFVDLAIYRSPLLYMNKIEPRVRRGATESLVVMLYMLAHTHTHTHVRRAYVEGGGTLLVPQRREGEGYTVRVITYLTLTTTSRHDIC